MVKGSRAAAGQRDGGHTCLGHPREEEPGARPGQLTAHHQQAYPEERGRRTPQGRRQRTQLDGTCGHQVQPSQEVPELP